MTTTAANDKPVIGIMGEFSAGKSTLSNLLIGEDHLPRKVTATRLPPVWLTYGPKQIIRVLEDGSEEEQHVSDLGEIPFDGTKFIRCSIESPMLADFDMIDFPGISDPNLPMSNWEDMVSDVSAVIWCTHATQSWRQSEVGVWQTVPEEIRKRSILLITRFDKLKTDNEKKRVLARVKSEAGGLFNAVYPVALLRALNSERGSSKWIESGAESLFTAIARICAGGPTSIEAAPEPEVAAAPPAAEPRQEAPVAAAPRRVRPEPAAETPAVTGDSAPTPIKRIMPRRVSAGGFAKRERPPARSNSERHNFLEGPPSTD